MAKKRTKNGLFHLLARKYYKNDDFLGCGGIYKIDAANPKKLVVFGFFTCIIIEITKIVSEMAKKKNGHFGNFIKDVP